MKGYGENYKKSKSNMLESLQTRSCTKNLVSII